MFTKRVVARAYKWIVKDSPFFLILLLLGAVLVAAFLLVLAVGVQIFVLAEWMVNVIPIPVVDVLIAMVAGVVLMVLFLSLLTDIVGGIFNRLDL